MLAGYLYVITNSSNTKVGLVEAAMGTSTLAFALPGEIPAYPHVRWGAGWAASFLQSDFNEWPRLSSSTAKEQTASAQPVRDLV